jgi:hypothetical protein
MFFLLVLGKVTEKPVVICFANWNMIRNRCTALHRQQVVVAITHRKDIIVLVAHNFYFHVGYRIHSTARTKT